MIPRGPIRLPIGAVAPGAEGFARGVAVARVHHVTAFVIDEVTHLATWRALASGRGATS